MLLIPYLREDEIELIASLRDRYKPTPVKWAKIPKLNGGMRKLGDTNGGRPDNPASMVLSIYTYKKLNYRAPPEIFMIDDQLISNLIWHFRNY